MRLPGRMLPGSGAGPFTGQSESRRLPTSRNAAWRVPARGPMSSRPACRRTVSRAERVVVAAGVLAAARVRCSARAATRVESVAARRGSVSGAGAGCVAGGPSTVARGSGRAESRAATGGRAESRAATGAGGDGCVSSGRGALRAHPAASDDRSAVASTRERMIDRAWQRIGMMCERSEGSTRTIAGGRAAAQPCVPLGSISGVAVDVGSPFAPRRPIVTARFPGESS